LGPSDLGTEAGSSTRDTLTAQRSLLVECERCDPTSNLILYVQGQTIRAMLLARLHQEEATAKEACQR
jgi:hypothetical protein